MRFVFVNWAFENHGSAQDLHSYAEVARELGHEVVLYGPPSHEAFNYSLDVGPDDAVVFIFEFTTRLAYGEKAGLLKMLGRVPRERRIVIDCDGKYNDAISVEGDVNHPDDGASHEWVEVCDSLSDRIFQPTHHPLRPNVRPFFFHAYNPEWEVPLEPDSKPFGMVYVGNNWFRWRRIRRVLDAVASVRDQVGRIGLVGQGWDRPDWGGPIEAEEAYFTDREYLEHLGVEIMPPIRFDDVIDTMSQGLFSPVVYRPLFDHLGMVTCRTYETMAANTIALLALDEDHVREIYGEPAVELLLPKTQPEQKILDFVRRPEHYLSIVEDVRTRLRERYSYKARLLELVEIMNGGDGIEDKTSGGAACG